ncbi:MAG: hypothetical protein ACOYOP_05310 [Microthrixaceae bacterium]
MGIESTGYKILLLVHLLAVVVAFGGNFIQPMLRRAGNASDEAFGKAVMFIQLPAVIVLWVAGMGLVGMSDELYQLSQTWILIALVAFLVAAVVTFLVGRAYRNGSGDKVAPLVGVLHLSLLVGVIVMVWKPGLA